MRIQRTPRRANFTVLGNDVLRNRELSFTARGVLGYLLSLPDGADEDVRKLADKNPRIGRKGIRDAVDELIAKRYYFRHTYRDDRGRVRTDTYVFDTPQDTFSPVPSAPGTGPTTPGAAGTSPSGIKDSGKDRGNTPPNPPAEQTAPAASPTAREGTSGTQDKDLAEAARILRRLAAIDSRLKLSERHVAKLAPEVADWLDRGATIAEITDAVTQGLPPKVYSASRLISDRLDRKRPERKRQWKTYADCETGCGGLLPAGQEAGICADCALGTTTYFEIDCTSGEVTEAPDAPATEPLIGGPNAAWRAARAAMRTA
ncbi:hypothetical protein ACFY1P_02890 [Streptomyces sp. NPDC001407]|uniref:hypothetical protein n=1 Tax=Streptomyces sp. NPDC001407 TaxID=3364573 RepID=UPI0036CFB60A